MELLMRKLYSLWGSNPRPMAHKTIALTTELREPCYTMCNQLILSVRVHMCRVVADVVVLERYVWKCARVTQAGAWT